MLKRISTLLALLIASISAQAITVDFTDASKWSGTQGLTSYSSLYDSIGLVTITANTGELTFNAGDNAGCAAGQPGNGLICDGDGIGINDDEITQGGSENITVNFAQAVNIDNIYFLDLFLNDNGDAGKNEVAVMTVDGTVYNYLATDSATDGTELGGFFVTNFTGLNISSILFSGNDDGFSDYALAAIDVSPVPIPGAAILFGSALLGFFGFKRRRAA